MSTVARALIALSTTLLCASGARADVIHVPSEAATISQALTMAVDGDVVLLAPGNYPFAVVIDGKAVSLVGDGAGVQLPSLTVSHLPAGAVVLIQNLTIGLISGGSHDAGILCMDSEGAILIRNCMAVGGAGSAGVVGVPDSLKLGGAGIRIKDCGTVEALDSTFTGGAGGTVENEEFQITATAGGPGINVRGTKVALFGVTAIGGAGGDIDDTISHSGGAGGAGLLNITGVVHASGCTLVGGHGGHGDCSIFSGCGSGGYGGDAVLQQNVIAAVSLRDNTYAPGGGGSSGDGFPSPDGTALHIVAGTLTQFPAAYRSIAVTSPVREGQVSTLTMTGLPGDLAFVHVGLQPGWLLKPFLQGAYLLEAPLFVLFFGAMPGSQLSVASTVPELGPGILALPVHLQLIIGDGAGYRLGPAVQQLLLDASQ